MNTGNINYLIPENASMGIYKITAPDGHYYIGSTVNFQKRIKDHFRFLENGNKAKKDHNYYWQNVYNNNPNWVWNYELIEKVNCSALLEEIEQKYLNEHFGKPLCMNVNPFAIKPPSRKGIPSPIKGRPSPIKGYKNPKVSLALAGKKRPIASVIKAAITRTGMKYKTRKDKGLPRIKMKKPWSQARRDAHLKRRLQAG